MKSIPKKILSLAMALFLVIGTIAPVMLTAHAADYVITSSEYLGGSPYGGGNTNARAEINDGELHGLCAEPAKDVGAPGTAVTLLDADATIRGLCYFASQTSDLAELWRIHHAAAEHLGLNNAGMDAGVRQYLADAPNADVPDNFLTYVGTPADGGQTMIVWGLKTQGTLSLTKASSKPEITNDNGCYSLLGAVYGVYNTANDARGDNARVATLTTDASGHADAITLDENTYYLREITAPTGMSLNPTVYTAEVRSGENTDVAVTDTPISDPINIALHKRASVNGQIVEVASGALAGAEYIYRYYAGQYDTAAAADASGTFTRSWTYKTNANGRIVFDDESFKVSGDPLYYNANGHVTCPIGTVTIQETKAPNGFLLDPTVYVTHITADGSGAESVDTYNAPTAPEPVQTGDIQVRKSAEDGPQYAVGVRFHLAGSSAIGAAVDLYETTNSSGVATFSNVPIGTNYSLTEVDTASKYVVPAIQSGITVTYNTTTGTTVQNVLKRGSLAVTKTSEDGRVFGVQFHLHGTSLSGATVDLYETTNSSGVATFSNVLISGSTPYTLEEVGTKAWYYTPATQNVAILQDTTTNATVANVLKRGTVKVTKTAEDGLVEGLKFHLVGTSLSGAAVDLYATTDSSGMATFSNVLISGDTPYTLEEVGTPVRYVVPAAQMVTVVTDITTEKTFSNILKKFRVTVSKQDMEKGNAQGDATLAGASYGVYKAGVLQDTYTTDENGQFTTKYYVCGNDWTTKEISPSTGYLLNTTVYPIDAAAGNFAVQYSDTAVTVNEQVIKGDIALVKHTDNGDTQIETPEVGAEFDVYLKAAGSYAAAKPTERSHLVCDENGYAQTQKLPYGVYTMHQTKSWEGRDMMADFDVFIGQDGQTYHYIINNGYPWFYVKVVKADAETSQPIAAAGTGFQIYRADGSLVKTTFTYPTPTTIDTFYTNNDGYLITPEQLPYGRDYRLVEVQAPEGYVLNSTPVHFDVTPENSIAEGNITYVKVVQPDMAQKGVINISKSGEVFATVTEANGVYQPVYEVRGLPDAVYQVIAAEDIVTPDGTVRAVKGSVVDTVTTDADGKAASKALYLGQYDVIEATAPEGYVLDATPHNVSLTYAGQDIEVTSASISASDARQHLSIDLNKAMEQDEAFGIGTNGEMANVSFGLYAAADITAADGAVIPTNGLIELVTPEKNGKINFLSDLPIGTYYAKEKATDPHYLLNSDKYPIKFNYAGQDTATVVAGNPTITNQLLRGVIQGHKTSTDGTALAGAVFGLFAPDAINFTADAAIQTASSGTDGGFSFAGVRYGDWQVVELTAPEGYVLDAAPHKVSIHDDGQVVTVEAVNRAVPAIHTTATVDGSHEALAIRKVTLVDTVSYSNLIIGKTYTVSGSLMDRETGKAVLDAQNSPVTASTTFTATAENGSVDVIFNFDASGLAQHSVVVFESLTKDGETCAIHADLADEGQTVRFEMPIGKITLTDQPTLGGHLLSGNPLTGDMFNAILWIALGTTALLGMGVVICVARTHKSKKAKHNETK